MDVLKVFTDEPLPLDAAADEPTPRGVPREPASLESLLHRPTYARAYLAGSRLGPDGAWRTGLTALSDPDLWLAPLQSLVGESVWTTHPAGLDPLDTLGAPGARVALCAAPLAADVGALARVAEAEDRAGWSALRSLLDAQPRALVLTPEPAHDGWDWVLYAARPLRERLVRELRRREAPGARRLVMPYQRARGEHKFYLERWALEALPPWAEEV